MLRTAQLLVRPHGVLRSSSVASGRNRPIRSSNALLTSTHYPTLRLLLLAPFGVSMTVDYRFTVISPCTPHDEDILCP